MSGGYRFKRDVALGAAEALIGLIAPACIQVAIAGSLRRGKHSVGDVEIVALPVVEERAVAAVPGQLDLFGHVTGGTAASVERVSQLDARLDELVAAQIIHRARPFTRQKGVWGAKHKQVWMQVTVQEAALARVSAVAHIPIDLYIVTPPAQWGSIFTIRTGPGEFVGSQGLMKYINTRTPYRQTEGRLIVAATGEEVPTPTEQDYFQALNLPWIAPADRSEAKLWQVAGSRRVRRPRPLTGNGCQLNEPADAETTPTIQAITLHQPWASLIAAGLKQYETRSWSTPYRGLLAIHAGKTEPTLDYGDLGLEPDEVERLPYPPPLGAVVAVARLVGCLPAHTVHKTIGDREDALGDFSPGRYAWQLELVTAFDIPIPACGQPGLWAWDGWDGVIASSPPPESDPPTGNVSGEPPLTGEVPQLAGKGEEALSTRLKAILANQITPGHRALVRMRLGCTRDEFELVLTSLKLLGEVEEDSFRRLHLVGAPLKRSARPPQLSTAPRVVNIKALPKGWRDDPAYAGYVYIGRAHMPKRLPASPWGNPFEIGRDGSRAQVIAKYRAWIETQPHLLQTIPYLAQADALVCWCAPDACHGDVLADLVERYVRGKWQPPSRHGALGLNDIAARRAIRNRLEAHANLV